MYKDTKKNKNATTKDTNNNDAKFICILKNFKIFGTIDISNAKPRPTISLETTVSSPLIEKALSKILIRKKKISKFNRIRNTLCIYN
jgi:hypothetical protein